MDPVPAHTDDDAQANFRQATAVLDAAHRRITALRQSLIDLTESIPALDPSTATGPPASASSVRPPHDAIVLTGPSSDGQESSLDMTRVRASLPPLVMDRLQQFEAEHFGDTLPNPTSSEHLPLPPAPSGTTIRQLPPPPRVPPISFNSPTLPSLPPPNSGSTVPPRSWFDSQPYRNRDTNPDDPSTALGRRVAARESRETRQVIATAYATIPQLQQILLDSTASIARNLENLNHSLLQRVQNPDSPYQRPDGPPTLSTDGRFRRSLQAGISRTTQSPVGVNAAQNSSPTLFPARPPPNRRLSRVMRESVRLATPPSLSPLGTTPSPVQSNNSARLSMLSSFSTVDNLSTPVTPLSNERPILFEEPESYVPPTTIIEPPSEPSRGYFIRRRVNPDGDDLVHNVFWNDPFDDPASPRQLSEYLPYRWSTPSTIRPPQRMESYQDVWPQQSRPPTEMPRRRRGWARLDADGNEIPTDEEDQLERLRSEHRIRAQQQSRAAAASQTEAPSDNNLLSPVAPPTTSSHPTPPSRAMTATGELDATIALMRSSRREPGSLANALDSLVSFDRSRRFSNAQQQQLASSSGVPAASETLAEPLEIFGSTEPYFVNPLPMPLSVMMPKKATLDTDEKLAKSSRMVVVGRIPKHASCAGR